MNLSDKIIEKEELMTKSIGFLEALKDYCNDHRSTGSAVDQKGYDIYITNK